MNITQSPLFISEIKIKNHHIERVRLALEDRVLKLPVHQIEDEVVFIRLADGPWSVRFDSTKLL